MDGSSRRSGSTESRKNPLLSCANIFDNHRAISM
jgi:hypothetical protein